MHPGSNRETLKKGAKPPEEKKEGALGRASDESLPQARALQLK